MGEGELDSPGYAEGQVAGCVEHCNEPLGSLKCGDFLLDEQQLASQKGLCCVEVVLKIV